MNISAIVFENDGYCHCCRKNVLFRATSAWLRDCYQCTNCGSIPRNRHLQLVLDTSFAGWEDKDIHEGSQGHPYISQYAKRYTHSAYVAGAVLGSTVDGKRCEDLERMTFPDATFDLFITQDILEHVFRPDLAIADIMRVLRPGGAHVFTAPKHKGLQETRQRARLSASGELEHLLPPEYHGSPEGEPPALVTWDYGYDFELLLSQWSGGRSVETHRTLNRGYGIDAEFNEVFVIRKPALS